jgi:hypothetical protein
MRSAKIILCILSIPGVCAQAQRISTQTPANESQPAGVVTMEPVCPVETPRPAKPGERSATVPVRVRYNPAAPGAKLTAPESLTISLAINTSSYANSQRTFVMSRTTDGAWETTIPLESFWSAIKCSITPASFAYAASVSPACLI